MSPLLLLLNLLACRDFDGDGARDGIDCALTDPAVHPGAVEVCNGIDDDCNGFVDDGVAIVAYLDVDGDGYGDPLLARRVCVLPADGSLVGTDCDDSDASINPSGVEVCDDRDNNCDGNIDEAGTKTWYVDADGDGRGTSASTTAGCIAPAGFAARSDDCDDADPTAWTGAPEICDGRDNDCDGLVDEGLPFVRVYADTDGDGHGDPDVPGAACGSEAGWSADARDCDDSDPLRGPQAVEIANGIDDDCDGYVDEAPISGFDKLDDALAASSPGDVLQFDEGTFAGTVDLTGFDVVLAGSGCARTVLYGDRNGPIVTMDGGVLARVAVVGGAGDTGGGVLVSGDATLLDVCVDDNRATHDGGGVAVVSGHADIVDSEIAGNRASGSGAGLWVASGASASLVRSRVVDNSAGNDGGGIASAGGLTADATVVAANRTVDDGGGIYLNGDTGVERWLTNVTIDGNNCSSDGPAVWSDQPVAITDALITGQWSRRPAVFAPQATFGAVGLWGNGGVDTANGWLPDAIRMNPRFQAAGGSTSARKRDWRLSTGSAALDEGSTTALDTDGSTADLGAYGGPLTGPDARAMYAVDSDSDGIPDGWELSHGTEPLRADASEDPDYDGLNNADEARYGSDPHDTDTDRDGITDGDEVAAGTRPDLAADHAPLAVVLGQRFAIPGEPIDLDASASTDPNGDALTFGWFVTSRPDGAVAEVVASGARGSLTPDRAGVWTVTCEVSDGGTTRSWSHDIDVRDAVVVPDDAPDLSSALATVEPGGAIALRPGRYVGGFDLQGVDVAIFGLGRAEDVLLDGADRGRVLLANAGESFTLAQLTIAEGRADIGAGLLATDGDARLVDVRFVGNSATNDGGGALFTRSTVDMEDAVVSANSAFDRGGGIRLVDGPFYVRGSTFSANTAGTGGGGLDIDMRVTGDGDLDDDAFVENSAPKGSAFARAGVVSTTWAWGIGLAGNRGAGGVMHVASGELDALGVAAARNTGSALLQRDSTATPPRMALLYGAVDHPGPLFSHADGVGIAVSAGAAIENVSLDGDPDDDVWAAPAGSARVDAGHPERVDPDGSREDIGPWSGPFAPRGYAPWSRDRDGDGMSDGWEARYGLNPDLADANDDPDGDGLDNLAEALLGTDPLDPDTDADGIPDGVEANGDDPTDPRGHRPIADAGPDVPAHIGTVATVDGSASRDPESDPLTYQWTLLDAPPGSAVVAGDLIGSTSAIASFTPDVRGAYRLSLVVHDPYGPSNTDLVVVHAWDELVVPYEYATFSDAVADAGDHDTIILPAGTYDGVAVLPDARTLRIQGAGVGATTIQGPGDQPVFVLSGGGSLDLSDLTVRRGLGDIGGLVGCTQGALTAHRVTFRAGVAYNGGAIALNSCTASFADVDVVGNAAGLQGSGLWARSSTVDWTRGTVAFNRGGTDVGGGIYLVDSTTRLRNLVVRHNASIGSGAGLYATGGTLDARFLTFEANDGPYGSLTVYNTMSEVRSSAFVGAPIRGMWRNGNAQFQTSENAYFGNGFGAAYPLILVSPTDQQGDPSFVGDSDLHARFDSVLIDAGSPAEQDPDGSKADIGAYGGPDAPVDFDRAYIDTDADGLPDVWEVAHGLSIGPDDHASDLDADGVTAIDELLAGSAPDRADSDADGVDDGVELAAGYDPADPTDHAPAVDLGAPLATAPGLAVTIDASSAFDPDGTTISHRWTVAAKPGTSAVDDSAITGATGAAAAFTPDRPGTYTLVDVVTDADGGVTRASVDVVVAGDVSVPGDYPSVEAAIRGVAPGSTVDIAAGTWPCVVDLAGKDVVLRGAGPDVTILDAEDAASALTAVVGEALDVGGLTIANGAAPRGGAIRASGGALTLEDVVLDRNRAVYGGGLYMENLGAVALTDTDLVDGRATAKGAGAWVTDASLDGVRTRFSGLSTGGSGAGIYANRSAIVLTNAMFSDDQAFTGGAIHLTGAANARSTAELRQVTGVFDHAVSNGSMVYAYSSDVLISSSIVAWNNGYALALVSTSTLNADHSVFSGNIPGTYNPGPGPGPADGVYDVDPRFVDASNDGDWTNDDLRLGPGSPAIDGGDPSVVDHDGTRSDAGFFGGPSAP